MFQIILFLVERSGDVLFDIAVGQNGGRCSVDLLTDIGSREAQQETVRFQEYVEWGGGQVKRTLLQYHRNKVTIKMILSAQSDYEWVQSPWFLPNVFLNACEADQNKWFEDWKMFG